MVSGAHTGCGDGIGLSGGISEHLFHGQEGWEADPSQHSLSRVERHQGLLQNAFRVSISGTRLKIIWAFLEISDSNVEQRRVKKIQSAV